MRPKLRSFRNDDCYGNVTRFTLYGGREKKNGMQLKQRVNLLGNSSQPFFKSHSETCFRRATTAPFLVSVY